MRLTSLLNENDTAFARFLADMSYNSSLQGNIVLPSFIHQTTQLAEFISKIYRDENIRRPNLSSQVYFGERAILASRNDTVDTINMTVLEKMPGEKVTLLSTDSADINDTDGLHTIPVDYLQSLNPSGLPPSQLELKVGAPVMLLRNIDPARGLCNGTRLIVMHIGQYMLRVYLANKSDAPIELIPRLALSTLEGNMPFMFSRKQFPVKLCFAMTINKPQGQSLKYVRVDLRRPPFMHD
jgi:ATP-dependent DNA helicase PIF1